MHDEVIQLVRGTREMLLPHWGKIDGEKKERDEYSLVTELDTAVERHLTDSLAKRTPDIPFVGEESGGSRDQPVFWLCDPIDGTLQYARGLPFCTVQLALIEDGKVNFSIIYDFLNDALYHAVRGKGAYHNGEPIHVSERAAERALLILETRFHANAGNLELSRRLHEKFHVMRSLVAGYEFVMVATGKVEGRVSYDPWGKDYDYAAGSLLVEEAGGIVTNVGASLYDVRTTDLIAATPSLFRALTEGQDAIFPIIS